MQVALQFMLLPQLPMLVLIRLWCGTTTTFLAGNNPTSGIGIWSIVGGSGGTLITPTSNVSQFIGLNGVSYTLRWTITNGTCISSDDVIINFSIPAASRGFADSKFLWYSYSGKSCSYSSRGLYS